MTELMLDNPVDAKEEVMEPSPHIDESFSDEYNGLLKQRKELEMIENILWHHYFLDFRQKIIEKL